MVIQHEFDGKKGSFYVMKGDQRIAEMVYVMAGDAKMIIEHTEVDESLKGQGVGKKLLNKLKIIHSPGKASPGAVGCSINALVIHLTVAKRDFLLCDQKLRERTSASAKAPQTM